MGGRDTAPGKGPWDTAPQRGGRQPQRAAAPMGCSPRGAGHTAQGPGRLSSPTKKKSLLLDFFMADSCVSHIDVLKNGLALAS